MKIYFIYLRILKTELYHYFSHISDKYFKVLDDNYLVKLYGITDDKGLANEFMDSRKSSGLFILKKKDIAKEDYESILLQDEYSGCKLKRRLFSSIPDERSKVMDDYNEFIPIVCTDEEYREASYLDNGSLFDQAYLYLTENIHKESDYYMLRMKYIKALDYLWYTSMYDLAWSAHPNFEDSVRDERGDVSATMLSYDMASLGYGHIRLIPDNISEFGRFLLLYGRMLYGRGDEDE